MHWNRSWRDVLLAEAGRMDVQTHEAVGLSRGEAYPVGAVCPPHSLPRRMALQQLGSALALEQGPLSGR